MFLNGPVVWLSEPYLPEGLVWVLVIAFWAWVGWLVGWKIAGNRRHSFALDGYGAV